MNFTAYVSSVAAVIVAVAAWALFVAFTNVLSRATERYLDRHFPLEDLCCCHANAYRELADRVADGPSGAEERSSGRERYVALLRAVRNATIDYLADWPGRTNAAEIKDMRNAVNALVDFEEGRVLETDINSNPAA
jgi:hypothetical protein